MPYRIVPDSYRYGEFDPEEALQHAEIPLGRELRGNGEERPTIERGGYNKEEALTNAELPPGRKPREKGNEDD